MILNKIPELSINSEPWDFAGTECPIEFENNLVRIMQMQGGIGLAANQIGITTRVFAIGHELYEDVLPKPFAVFNPEILEYGSTIVSDNEGCLSFPGLKLKVKRPDGIVVRYYRSNGEEVIDTLTGLYSRCFQHEYDHINGICFIDKVSRLKLNLAIQKQRKSK